MATLGDMVTAISARLLDTGGAVVTDVVIIDAINQSINYRKEQRFHFNEARADVTITDATDTIALPDDFLKDIGEGSLVINDNQSLWNVTKVRTDEFDWQYDSNGTGRPFIWTYRSGTASLYYIPDQDYAAVLRYVKDYDDFLTDGTQNATSSDWTTYGRNMIQNDTLGRLQEELRQDEKMAAYYTERGEAEAQRLITFTNDLNRTGTLCVETIL